MTLGLSVTGYPISRRFVWDGFTVQAFQKVVMQWQPATGQVYFLNVFDILHDAGYDNWLEVFRFTPPPLPPSFDAGQADFEAIAAQRLALLATVPDIQTVYWSAPAPLQQFGLPTSTPTQYRNHISVRFQRVVMQLWLEDVPWAKAGQVTIANGGDIAKEAGLIPGPALAPDVGPAEAYRPLPPNPPDLRGRVVQRIVQGGRLISGPDRPDSPAATDPPYGIDWVYQIEGIATATGQADTVWVGIVEQTHYYLGEGPEPRPSSRDELQLGQDVAVWFTGPWLAHPAYLRHIAAEAIVIKRP